MSNYRSKLISNVTETGRIEIVEVNTCQETGYENTQIRRVTDTRDPMIRQGLIDLGWTPPGAGNES